MMNDIRTSVPNLEPLNPGLDTKRPGSQRADATSFNDILASLLNDADKSIQKMVSVAGEAKDVNQVMLGVDEAKATLNLMLEISSKMQEMQDAHSEIAKISK
jgi:flagellar hook-basal body complex protein FliE